MTLHHIRTPAHRALAVLLCAFVLIAQLGAITHAAWHTPVSHAAGPAAGDHLQPSHDHDGNDPSQLCVFDAAFGQVLGSAPTSQSVITFAAAENFYSAPPQHGRVAAEPLAQRSRGPPALL